MVPEVVAAKSIHETKEYEGDAEIIEEALAKYAKSANIRQPQPLSASNGLTRYHPDPKLNKIMQTAIEMGGLPLERFIPKFKMDTPPMELWDVYEFVKQLRIEREKTGKVYESAVYVHLCEHGTIYVGLARINHRGNGTKTLDEAARRRLTDHRNGHESDTRANYTGIGNIEIPIYDVEDIKTRFIEQNFLIINLCAISYFIILCAVSVICILHHKCI